MKCQIIDQMKECLCTVLINLSKEWNKSKIIKVFIGTTKLTLEKTLQRYIYCTYVINIWKEWIVGVLGWRCTKE